MKDANAPANNTYNTTHKVIPLFYNAISNNEVM
jgi:hypothetical protein